jgi:hypothetical protein
VRDTKKLITSENEMVSASGTKRLRATPVRKSTGQEHHHGGDGAHQDGHRHLLGGVEHGLHAVAGAREVTVDVLELDDGVVDEAPDAEREAAEGEHVERLPRRVAAARRWPRC